MNFYFFIMKFTLIIIIRIDITRIIKYDTREEIMMPIKPREMEKKILMDGWVFKTQVGSHKQYTHPVKNGKVTIPFHCKTLPKGTENSILKQAGLK